MKKTASLIALIIGLGMLSINPALPSYGSSQTAEKNEDMPAFLKADGDCFAWKFYLLTATYDLVYRGVSKEIYDTIKENFDSSKYYSFPDINMYKSLPPETAKEVINTIIEKEGGHCSKEVLYEVPRCTYDPYPGAKSRDNEEDSDTEDKTIYNVIVHDVMDFDYFTKAIDFPIDENLVSQYEHFLKAHIIKKNYPLSHETSRHGSISLSCEEDCIENNDFYFHYYNSFGTCMIAKHYKHLKNHDIFDFKDYLRGASTNPDATLNLPSLDNFIKESDEITERYRKDSKLP